MKKVQLILLAAIFCGCGTQTVTKAPESKTQLSLPQWRFVKVFANNADEEPVVYLYPKGRWLEKFWVVQKPEQAKIANMYPTANGFVTEGMGLLDTRGKTISPFDKLQTEAVSDGEMIYTTNPQASDYIIALREDGSVAWRSRIGERSRGEGVFFIEEGNLVFLLETPSGYRITRFDRKSGSVVWQNVYEIESGFSSLWAKGSGFVWILTTIQSDKIERVLSKISARTGEVSTFDVDFRQPFAACKGFLWYLNRDKLNKFSPDTGMTVSIQAKDAISVQTVGQYVLLNSTKQPRILDPTDSSIHMLFQDQVQVFGDVVFQVMQKMVVAVDPQTRDELWKMDFDQAVQSLAVSTSSVAIQTTDKIYLFSKK
jgi:hypothetical protein